MNPITEYLCKYFYIGDEPQRITRMTNKTLFYRTCLLDNYLIVNNGNILTPCNKKYYHYSTDLDNSAIEHRITISNFIKEQYELYQDLNLDIYNNQQEGYFDSIFFNDSNLLKKIYQLQYYIESYKIISELLDSLDHRTDEQGITLFNKHVDNFDNIKSNIYKLTKNDNQIVSELFNYNKYIMSLRKLKYIVNATQNEYIENMNQIVEECPICLDEKSCTIGHFLCSHHLCNDCYKQLNSRICMLCRSL
jgi:hypothetical protein